MIREPFLLIALLPAAATAAAQSPEGWNGGRVLELVARARAERHSMAVDAALLSYRSEARGHVYFFVDRPDTGERTLVKADQVALELYWQAPDRSGQRIVGLRDEKVLPTNIRYHLDHLTVVQDDFSDHIRLGDGDEVEQVLHPLGPRSEDAYDFRLADSLTITFGTPPDEVRVYQVRVRPKDPEAPGFVGSVFLDRESAAVVRMSFTFTPASYVDPYLDYIRISLDNARWLGRYWLPYRQEAELRREMPILDFMAGSIIRGRYEIGDYRFNVPIPEPLLYGGRVSAAPPASREAFPFERGLYADLEEEGLAPAPSMEEIRAQAVEAIGRRYVSGLPDVRLHLRSASEAARYNRAEGLFLGTGLHFRSASAFALRLTGGYAVSRRRPSATLSLGLSPDQPVPTVRGYWDELRDIGPLPGASGLVNSLAGTLASRDYLDPWFARGAAAVVLGTKPDAPLRATLRWERHVAASDVVSEAGGPTFRPVRDVEEGDVAALDARARVDVPGAGAVVARGTLARMNGRFYGAGILDLEWRRDQELPGWGWSAGLSGGAVSGRAPVQELFLLGGRGTLPGHAYRGFVGDRFWLARALVTQPLLQPWVGLRAFAAAGATHLGARAFPAGWGAAGDSDGPRASVGAGLALGWDVVHLDLGRGLGGGGGWEVVLSVTERFRSWL